MNHYKPSISKTNFLFGEVLPASFVCKFCVKKIQKCRNEVSLQISAYAAEYSVCIIIIVSWNRCSRIEHAHVDKGRKK